MKRLLVGMLFAAAWPAAAQDAETFFHAGAQTFVTNDIEPAKEIVLEGLTQHPDDPWLLGLKALLEQQQEQEQQQQQQQQSQSQPNPEQDPQNQDPNQQEQPQPPQPQEAPEPPEPGEQEQQPQPQSGEEQSAEEREAGEMTEDEAEMLLDALRQREQAEREAMMREQIRRQSRQTAPVEKDW